MTKQQIALAAVQALKEEYPDARCSLSYRTPLQLLIATRLAAQCTDARVNMVTPALFARFPTLDAFCEGPVEDIEELVRSCGLYKTKAKDIFNMCRMLRDEFGGDIWTYNPSRGCVNMPLDKIGLLFQRLSMGDEISIYD